MFESELSFENGLWTNQDLLTMELEITEPEQKHNLLLFIEHSPEYQYQNIYLNIKTVFPDKNEVSRVIPVDLANDRGSWNAKCNSKNCKLQVYLQQDFKFRESGKYVISVEQYSREQNLEGIKNARIALFQSEK